LKSLQANIDSFLAALVGILFICFLTRHSGLGISPDSIYYTSTADNLLKGEGFYQFDGKPFVMFPVGFPFILAFIKLFFGNTFFQIIPFFNALLFGITIYVVGLIVEKNNTSRYVKWAILLVISFSPSLLEVYTMLWSETVFITEVVLFIYFGSKYFTHFNVISLLIIAFIAAIATDTRLAGVAVIATGCYLILMSGNLNWSKKVQHIILFGIFSSSIIVVNLIRNRILTQTLTGNRQKGVTPLLENVKYYGLVLSNWFPFSKWTNSIPVIIGCVFIGMISIIFIFKRNNFKNQFFQNSVVSFTLIYSIFMLTVATISRFETINNRLLAPFYIPCILTIGIHLNNWYRALKSSQIKFMMGLIFGLIVVTTLFQYGKVDLAMYNENNEGGIGGYSDDDWRFHSGVLNFLADHPLFFKTNETIFSNAAHAVYYKTNRQVQILPERKYNELVHHFNKLPSQLLIWFNNEDNPEVLTLQEVGAYKNLQIIGKFNDGVIYHCTSK
jgi:hypothetical protein